MITGGDNSWDVFSIIYNIIKDETVVKTEMLSLIRPRQDHSMVFYQGQYVVIGGSVDSHVTETCESWDGVN